MVARITLASWSRRAALRAGVGAAAAALLAACGEAASVPATATTAAVKPGSTIAAPTSVGVVATSATAATVAAPAASVAAATGGAAPAGSATMGAVSPSSFIMLTDTGAKLPTDKTTLRWVGTAGERKLFVDALVPAYQKAHANITIQYDGLPFTEIAKVLPLGIQNGNAPDLFELPSGFTGGQAVTQGWAHPLDDLIPNFAQWKAAFPPGSFVEGNNVFGGKTYSFPFESGKKNNALLLYNADYLKQAGVDTETKPLTWDEYRAAAKKLTQQGAGKYYGCIIAGGQASRLGDQVRFFGQMAGASGGSGGSVADLDFRTGEYNYTSDQYLAAIDLLLGIKADGSFFPGTVSLNVQQADSQFAQGVAAMMINGSYTFPQWKTDAPNFNYGVASQPIPNSGKTAPFNYTAGGGTYWAYAKTQQSAIVGDIMAYAGSEAGQIALINIIGGSQPSVFTKANTVAMLTPQAKKALALFDQQIRLIPSPAIRNPDVSLVDLEFRAISPDFGTTVQGIFTGQLSDTKKAMQDLKDRYDKELDRAIKAAQAKGAKVSRDDYKFPTWDPARDWTDADYAASKK